MKPTKQDPLGSTQWVGKGMSMGDPDEFAGSQPLKGIARHLQRPPGTPGPGWRFPGGDCLLAAVNGASLCVRAQLS